MTVYFVDCVTLSEMKLYFMELHVFTEAMQLFLLLCQDDLAYFLFLSIFSCFIVSALTFLPHLLDLFCSHLIWGSFCGLTQTLKTDVFGTDTTIHVDLK
jgi:hypothetical protein